MPRMLTIAGRLDRWDALIRSEAAKQRHSVAQVFTQLTFVPKPTLPGLLANKCGLKPVCCAMERKMLLGIKQRAERAAASCILAAAWYYLLLNKGRGQRFGDRWSSGVRRRGAVIG